jgi:two-component system response regulator GlrR
VPSLRFFKDNELLMEYRLSPGRTTLGRADSCDVALPGETISRLHCIVQGRGDSWALLDKSRHGIQIKGKRIEERTDLADATRFELGPYQVDFQLESREAAPTAAQERDMSHELIHTWGDEVAVEQAVLVVEEGALPGHRVTLVSNRVSVGGEGSMIELGDPGLLSNHCWLTVSRGRVMLESGQGAAWLDGSRVRGITPLYADECFRIGSSLLRVERNQDEELPFFKRFGEMVADNQEMTRLFGVLRRMAGHHYTVLIVGESGTGKELVARGIHDHSPRADRPYIALNCGAISPQLFESELFGHEPGAFTDARKRKDGAFHEADGGTIFLDEIGELPESAQAKLLRTLETGEVRRVGANLAQHPDVRVIAATNRDLAADVASGRFREDLFFRLAVLSVRIPPLRDRPDDLEALSGTLCRKLHPEAFVTPDAMEILREHSWPGNVRELRNVLTRAYVMGGTRIQSEYLSFHLLETNPTAPAPVPVAGQTLKDTERQTLERVLRRHDQNRSAAARELGIARSTLLYKMKKHGMR